MSTRFFDLDFDVYVPGRWYLAEPHHRDGPEIEDIWQFIQGKPVELHERLQIPLSQAGKALDFDKTTVGGAPIVNARVAAVFRELASHDIQLFPVEVEGQSDPYFLLNVARELDCIDDAACTEARRWLPEDNRPDRLGEYHVVSGLRIDRSKVGGARVFRLWGYHPPIIVTGDIKDALESTGVTGARFVEV
ncbi:hypothetical protein D7Y13_21460 [Corallococcus praedator]|uniref:Immunity MXAN-0049 protein domain-containing protein n=1 Tax=Corallococcus praedator TaxID=2316724 RepID=A0ABX9QEP6_9BACT|nr:MULTISPECIES: DUF1629 domain-containing protein [Corallococcus]RKH28164.1 hypothetical protein D7X75_25205 [Corallococcus sp. CA031C]RKI05891.1 hypothetical protein D7Y13_21460 [Corallococcus praedator]